MNEIRHSGSKSNIESDREKDNRKIALELAEEGIVLLKNDGILPLSKGVSVALLGNGASRTVKGGTGSGDVNNRYNVTIYEGMKNKGISIVSDSWIQDYEERYNASREEWKNKIYEDVEKVDNPFDAYADNPFSFPDGRDVKKDDLAGADVAIYVISRISGEGKDRRKEKGDYYLSDREYNDIHFVCEHIPVILIVNAGGPVELTDLLLNEENVKAVLNISQPGEAGGDAVANILTGDVNPSGKLTTSWAKRYEDIPFSDSFGYLNGDLSKDEYREGIYVGYRYFDTFGVETLFPFGHGLSYTEFNLKFVDIGINNGKASVKVSVTNTGKYAGKEVVQLYVSLPDGIIEKERRRLVGFSKTINLKPGERQSLNIEFPQKNIASFNEDTHEWIIEKGIYGVWIGNSLYNSENVAYINVESSVTIENTGTICASKDAENVKRNSIIESQRIKDNIDLTLPNLVYTPYKEKNSQPHDSYAEEQTIDELIYTLLGNITEGASMLGSAGKRVPGSAGETTERLEQNYALSSLIMADGPAGLRLRQCYEVSKETDDVYGVGVLGSLENGYLEPMEFHEDGEIYYQYCTAFPVGTAIAQTWNKDIMNKFGNAVGTEMKEFGINLWLAPGMNIQRNPLCGRNFEYFSEDPVLSGVVAENITKGVQNNRGCGVTIKHFACNNQEDNRMGVNVIASERTLREIYFRGFEIAVKEAAPVAVMSSYNLVNGVHVANNKDMCTDLLRGEWGYDGLVMTDWNTTVPEDGSIPWKCCSSGNDVIMPGNTEDINNIKKAYKDGMLKEEEIRRSAGRLINTIERLKNA